MGTMDGVHKALRVLIVEDSEDDALLVLRELRRGGYAVTSHRVQTREDMMRALKDDLWDVVLSDFSMPQFSAPAALAVLQELALDIPFIIISGTVGEEAAVTAMKAGAHDFFPKNKITRLVPAIERELREAQDRQNRRQIEQELASLYRATQILFQFNNLLELGQQIAESVVREFNFDDCGVMLVDVARNSIIRLARAGDYDVHPEIDLHIDGSGLVPFAIRKGEVVYAQDVTQHPAYVESNSTTKSELVIPLATPQGIIGVLDLQSATPRAFSERDLRLLTAYAKQAAAALEIVKLYEELNTHAAELEWRVARRTVELREAKEQVEAILNNAGDTIVLLDINDRITQMNPAFEQTFGYATEDFELEFFATDRLFTQPDRVASLIDSVRTDKTSKRAELKCKHADGSLFDVDAIVSPIASPNPQDLQIVCSLRDISAQKELEDGLRQALDREKELNELKSRFTSMVSHEFRTPLAVILTSISLLHNYSDRMDVEKREQKFQTIKGQVKYLTTLLDDVLSLSRADTVGLVMQVTEVNLVAFCQDMIEQVQAAINPDAIIEFITSGDCHSVQTDDKLLRHILHNLLSNAIKYSLDASKIVLNVACQPGTLIISVEDSGIGIPEHNQKNLFTSFHRADNVGTISGTGLGLAIVKRAVDACDGTISFESKEGVGTTFTVKIPIAL